ncbi:MAG: hypothetical protein QOH63_271 [Acidobacteriota bacterium]|jgi:hypothetical protein|nr:hypothetical protein [Acidobacteriota bacterium]
MSVNKDLPHIFVLPEDRANQQLANGFHLEINKTRQMQVLDVARGWKNVLNLFNSDHVIKMNSNSNRFMVLLIDFDRKKSRLKTAKAAIPKSLADRVFVLGVWSEPEAFKKATLDSYETLGSKLAKDCREQTDTTWRHPLLQHNTSELDRLRKHVRPILF